MARAGESPTAPQGASIASLFSADEAAKLADTLPIDREVRFRIRLQGTDTKSGVFVFISPGDSGELPAAWVATLDASRLIWVAADGYGNSRPTAERLLVAVLGLKLANRLHPIDRNRVYVAGMSGGGRVASQAIAHFPELFSGAFFNCGANFLMPGDAGSRNLLAQRRMVFLTGSRDFNRREMKSNYSRYRDAGVGAVLLLDERNFGHELATAGQLERAVSFLDAR
jgi:pimeloyl-ACP methyl ester carboxylesterase